MEYRFNEQASAVLRRAERAAEVSRHGLITPDHLLVGILLEPACTARRVLALAGVDAAELGHGAFSGVPGRDENSADRPPWSRATRRVIRRAFFESFSMDKRLIGTEHLLLGLAAAKDERVSVVLERAGLTASRAEEYVRALAGDPLILAQQELTTAPAVEAVRRAIEKAVGRRAEALEDEHLLWALNQVGGSHATSILEELDYRAGGAVVALVSPVRGPIPNATRVLEAIRRASALAAKFEHRHVGSEHLLLALVSRSRKIQKQIGIGSAEVERLARRYGDSASPEPRFARPEVDVSLAGQWFSAYADHGYLTGPGF